MCRFSMERSEDDMDSIDVTIKAKGYLVEDSISYSPNLAIQLKATSTVNTNEGASDFGFHLSLKNYNDLIPVKTNIPRILCVLLLPNNLDESIIQTPEKLTILKCMYWYNLKGMPKTTNESGKTIRIPLINIMSCEILKEMMIKISKEEDI